MGRTVDDRIDRATAASGQGGWGSSSALGVAVLMVASALVAMPRDANAAGESVNIWLTTTNDAGGRAVTRGLQQQSPVTFASTSPAGNQTINVNENTTYQQFEGAGASFTDTAAYVLKGSGGVSQATRDAAMRKLFDPVNGIGVNFLRNPLGSSDLARSSYSYDDTCCDLNDFSLNRDVDVMALTKQAKQINPNLKVMASPWSAPAWMKDNNDFKLGWLKAEYYPMYAQYFVKYIQGYAAQGVKIDYVTVQNEPTCCATYPSMNWNGEGLRNFTLNHLFPAFRAAGISTKTLILDWNWDKFAEYGAPQLNDAALRNDPLFGGIAWHGYGGDVSTQTTVHNQFPNVNAYMTEHSGGTWIPNQQTEDMLNLVDYTRNWDKSWIKWSLALDQFMNPHNGGCDVCTGLLTVQNGGSRAGQIDYTIEYYTMGHLTKFVKQGAYRIDTNSNNSVPNVAWKNPDGSKALIAYNNTGGNQSVKVNWGNQSFTYTLPTKTSATFTWGGTPGNPSPTPSTAHRRHRADHRPGRQVRRRGRGEQRQRHRGAALRLQRHGGAELDPVVRRHAAGAGQVPGRDRRLDGERREGAAVRLQRQCGPAMDLHGRSRPGESGGEQVPGRHRQRLDRRHEVADLDVRRRGQPEMEPAGVTGRGRTPGPGSGRPPVASRGRAA